MEENRKLTKIICAVISAIIVLGLVIKVTGSILNEDEQLAYQNAVQMQSMMKNSDSFELYDEMFLLKFYDEDGALKYTYTIFKYGGANGFGAIVTDEAIFKNGKFIMNYDDEPDKDDYDYATQLSVMMDVLSWRLTGDTDTVQMVEINVGKIKSKMGLK